MSTGKEDEGGGEVGATENGEDNQKEESRKKVLYFSPLDNKKCI